MNFKTYQAAVEQKAAQATQEVQNSEEVYDSTGRILLNNGAQVLSDVAENGMPNTFYTPRKG